MAMQQQQSELPRAAKKVVDVWETITSRDMSRRPDLVKIADMELESAVEELRSALAESERRFRWLSDAMPLLIWQCNQEGKCDYFNKGWLDFTGRTMEQEVGDGWAEGVHREDAPRVMQTFLSALSRREGFQLEYRLRHHSGEHRWILDRGVLRLDSEGQFMGYIGGCLDITERKRMEEALSESEAKYRTLFENMAEEVHFWKLVRDEAGQIKTWRLVDANPAALRTWNRNLDEIKGKTTDEIFGAGSTDHFMPVVQKVFTEGAPHSFEDYFAPLGRTFRFITVPLGEYFITTGADISERKRAGEALAQSEQRLMMAKEAANLGIFDTDITSGTIRWDHRLRTFWGLGPDEPVTVESFLAGVHPDDRAAVEAAVDKAMNPAGDGRFFAEHRVITRDGRERWQAGTGQVSFEQGKAVRIVGTVQDITERKRAEQALRESTESLRIAKAEAEHANAAKDHFLAVLSHELRNPLTPVLPALSALKKLLPPQGEELLEIARRNVELEARLIDDLLDVTRIARGKIELDRKDVDLATILHRAAEVCRDDIEARQLHFGITIEDGPHQVHADAARLQQVFWNLIKNAVKFTPSGGRVTVRCWRDNGHAIVDVADSGEGIAGEAQARLFDAFEQESRATTRQFGGLGLGLAISKALVEMHGGTIQVHSAGKGQGATFSVTLKMAELQKRSEPIAPTLDVPIAPRNKLRILFVEDHGETVRVMRQLLIAEGHKIQTAGDVATALELASREKFDVLVSDLGLPDGTGHDLMRELFARGRQLPSIALSGYGMADDLQRSREAGFLEHLTKPVNFDALLTALSRATNPPSA
jgi:PAS domain S-box-containing protein